MTRLLSAAALALCFAIGCTSGKKEGPATQPDPLTSKDGFCEEWAEAACNDTVVDECVASSAAACTSAQMEFCLGRAPDGRYSLEAAETCIEAVRSAYSDAVLTLSEYETVVGGEAVVGGEIVFVFGEPCNYELRAGAVDAPGEGDECDADTNPCAGDDLTCAPDPSGSGTTCYTIVVRSGGQTCGGPRQVCAAGFYCDGTRDPAACIERPGLGVDCSTWPCRENLYCNENDQCEAKGGVGDACGSDEECDTGICLISTDRTLCADEVELSAFSPVCQDLS